MFAVIADDFTGAAELAGISLRYGLSVELCVAGVEYKNADVLIVSTDSRSLNKKKAIDVTEKTVKQVLQLKPEWIFKKIDSVLRGYVLEELKVQMRMMNKTKAFIMPANPSMGRTIIDGQYLVNGIMISDTAFAHDPEFPVKTSSVKKMFNDEVEVAGINDEVPKGIILGEVTRVDDYNFWVNRVDEETVLVGGGDFYTALLNRTYKSRPEEEIQMLSPHLYVCGTSFKERKEQIKKLDCVSYLPEVINDEWLKKTSAILKKYDKAIVAIDQSSSSAAALRTTMAKAVKEIVEKELVKEIFIEGGSTAAAVFQGLNIKKLEPVSEVQRGVVRMKAVELFITVKPGSYELPQSIKNLYSLK